MESAADADVVFFFGAQRIIQLCQLKMAKENIPKLFIQIPFTGFYSAYIFYLRKNLM